MTAHYNVIAHQHCKTKLKQNRCNAPHPAKCTSPCPWGALVSKLELFAKHRGTRQVPLCLVMSTGLEAGGNGAVALVPKTKGAVVSAPKQYRAAHNVLSGFLHIPDLLEN